MIGPLAPQWFADMRRAPWITEHVIAEFLAPAITLTSSAPAPVPPVLIELSWSPTLPRALTVAVLAVLAAALTIARRPDAAAGLRAAEAA